MTVVQRVTEMCAQVHCTRRGPAGPCTCIVIVLSIPPAIYDTTMTCGNT